MLISKSFIVICCLYTMVKKVEHQHMAKHDESPECPVDGCRFGSDYNSLKTNKFNECPNCLENENPCADQMCVMCQKLAVKNGWYNVTCKHLTGKLYRLREELSSFLDVKPTELSKQEIEHIEAIVSMFEKDSEYLYEITHNEMAKSRRDYKSDPPVIRDG